MLWFIGASSLLTRLSSELCHSIGFQVPCDPDCRVDITSHRKCSLDECQQNVLMIQMRELFLHLAGPKLLCAVNYSPR